MDIRIELFKWWVIGRFLQPSYDEYIHTSAWRYRRQKAIKRAKGRCQLCNDNTQTLHAHHRDYSHLGYEKDYDLTVLCESCHMWFHSRFRNK